MRTTDRTRWARSPWRAGGAAAAGLLALVLAACSTPGSPSTDPSGDDSEGPEAQGQGEITERITPEQVAELGDITLLVWADQGEQDLMDVLVPQYESEYPNVKVEVQFKSYSDLVSTVVNAMNSSTPPDVTQGNQGWATDGMLVKAGLIRPLDDVAAAYEYVDAVGDAASQLSWSEDGSVFGSGRLFGMSPDNQMVGIFYNRGTLADLGLDVPKTFEDFEAALAAAKAAGVTPITLGNSDPSGAMSAFSVVQGAFTAPAQTRDWIQGVADSTFDVESNHQALQKWVDWVGDGYFTEGYDGIHPDDAAASFANGEGLFFISGNWQAGNISDGEKFGFIAGPKSSVGEGAASGSFGLPWHISSKTTKEAAAIAFVGMINAPETGQTLADVLRVPVHADGVTSDNPMFTDLVEASAVQLGNGGSLLFFDWATDTMFDTFTKKLQEAMAERVSPGDVITAIQSDWDAFQADKA